MKELAQRLPDLKHQTEVDRKTVRSVCEEIAASFGDGLLGHLVQRGRVGEWIKPYFDKYQKLYWQLLWDIAEWEEIGSQQLSAQEEREECLRKAAHWYEKCAFAHVPTANTEGPIWLEGQVHISELALQRSLDLYGRLGETSTVERIFTTYHDRMHSLNEDYSPEKATKQSYKRAIGSAEKDTARSDSV